MNVDSLIRGIHLIAASMWAGGALILLLRVMPTMKALGAQSAPFATTLLRRGGYGLFFGPTSIITVLSGGYVYSKMRYSDDPFGTTSNALLTIGAIVAILAFLHSLATIVPGEVKMKKIVKAFPAQGPPPADRVAEIQRLAAKQVRATLAGGAMIALALVLMALHRAF